MEIKLQDGSIVSDMEFRQLMPNVSMPAVLTKEVLDQFNAVAVLPAPQPTYDASTQRIQRNGVTTDSLGNTIESYEVVSLSDEEIAAKAVAEAEGRVQKYTPPQIITALETMEIASTILANTDDITKAKFYTAKLIREDDPRLLAALSAVGKTIDDLKAVIS
jgi:hypothetical protein